MPKYDYIGVYGGGIFPLLNPTKEHVDATIIAHSLSQICRFNGHTNYFWSVAQHSLLVSDIIESGDIQGSYNKKLVSLVGLLHDASEAFINDIPRPIKETLNGYDEHERKIQNLIYESFGLSLEYVSKIYSVVKKADDLALHIEALQLMNPCEDWLHSGDFKNPLIQKWIKYIIKEDIETVKNKYINKLNELIHR